VTRREVVRSLNGSCSTGSGWVVWGAGRPPVRRWPALLGAWRVRWSVCAWFWAPSAASAAGAELSAW